MDTKRNSKIERIASETTENPVILSKQKLDYRMIIKNFISEIKLDLQILFVTGKLNLAGK